MKPLTGCIVVAQSTVCVPFEEGMEQLEEEEEKPKTLLEVSHAALRSCVSTLTCPCVRATSTPLLFPSFTKRRWKTRRRRRRRTRSIRRGIRTAATRKTRPRRGRSWGRYVSLRLRCTKLLWNPQWFALTLEQQNEMPVALVRLCVTHSLWSTVSVVSVLRRCWRRSSGRRRWTPWCSWTRGSGPTTAWRRCGSPPRRRWRPSAWSARDPTTPWLPSCPSALWAAVLCSVQQCCSSACTTSRGLMRGTTF